MTLYIPVFNPYIQDMSNTETKGETMLYEFSANGTVFGRYSGSDLGEARETFAQDAGYTSWSAMVEQAEEFGGNTVEAREVLENGQLGSAI